MIQITRSVIWLRADANLTIVMDLLNSPQILILNLQSNDTIYNLIKK